MWCISLLLIWISLFVPPDKPSNDYEASVRAYRENNLDSARSSIDRAIAHYQAEGKLDSLVFAQVQKALVVWDMEGLEAAFQLMNNTLQLMERLPSSHPSRVAAYSRLGQLHMYRHEFPQAAVFFRKAEAAAGNQPDLHTVILHNHIAVMYLMQENYALAKHHADRAHTLNLRVEGKDGVTMPMILQTMFFISRYSEDFAQALLDGEEYQRVTRLYYPPNHPRMGTMHNSLAVIYETLRQYDEAMYHRRRAVDIHTDAYIQSGDGFSLASAYQNIGYLYGYLYEPFLAQEYLEKGSRLLVLTYGEEGFGMVRPLADMAVHKYKIGKYDEAEALFEKSLTLQQRYAPEDLLGLAYVEGFLAEMYLDRQDFVGAEKLLQTVLGRYEQAAVGHTENALLARFSLAQALSGLGRHDEALEIHQRVLEGIQRLYPAGNDAIAYKWYGLAEVYLQMGDPDQAYAISDSLFSELMLLPELPTDFSEWLVRLPFSYHTMLYVAQRAEILFEIYGHSQDIAVLEMLLGLVEAYSEFVTAHLYAFRSQAALVDLADVNKRIYSLAVEAGWVLSEEGKKADYTGLAFSYAEKGKALLMRLNTNNMLLDEGQKKTTDKELQEDQASRQRIAVLNAQYLNSNRSDSLLGLLSTAMEDYQLFQDRLKKENHPLLSARHNLATPALRELRDALLTNDETLLEYTVTDRSVFIFVITANSLHMHRSDRKVLEDMSNLREFYGVTAAKFLPPAHRLYQHLVQPVEKHFAGRRLLIVPDGDLYYLNFEVLVSDDREQGFSTMPFLIHRYEISYLLSAVSAMQFKKVFDTRKQGKALLFAPVFTDEMKENYRLSLPAQDTEDEYLYLLRQPFALQAAQRVANWFPNDLFSGQEAEERLFKQAASDYRILHLGTHAEINNHSPLHSRLYFAKAMFDDPTNADDGYLHAYEIYTMQLRAEMAVLTACETGTGTWRNGEGVISLAHGFMQAGCSSVLMTLWKVDEQASNEVITHFYKYLSKGDDKRKALRRAKLDLLAGDNERLAHPYYWAGVALVGDPSPIYTKSHGRWWISGLLVLGALGWFLYQKKTARKILNDR